jgi:hypothetical protein
MRRNTVLHYGKDGALTASAGSRRAKDRRGLTALFWSNVNPYGTFRLDMDKRLDLGSAAAVPRPRTPADTADRSRTETQ